VPFDLQPTLAGQLVRLRPLLPDDHDALLSAASDPLIWEQHPDKSRSQPEGFRAFFEGALASRGAFLVTDASTGGVIGTSRYHGYDAASDEVEIGWTFLARSHWGGQYNREMKALMLQHAFRFVGRVVFLIDPANDRSQRAVEKIGGVRIADRTDASGRTVRVFQITARERLSPSVRHIWDRYLKHSGESADRPLPAVWHFCDNEVDADTCAALVLEGRKRATASSQWFFDCRGERLPVAGDLDIVTNWSGIAQCIIRTTAVEIVPYNEVTAEFAATEGEGDGSLGHWRSVHWPYYHRELEGTGCTPAEDMPIVCQRFEVAFR
jgi:uncharacterized protein YhfF/RimJ/RimL family protein N-acetyltransferase